MITTAFLMALSAAVGFILGSHMRVDLDLGVDALMSRDPVVLPRRTLVVALALAAVLMLGVSVAATVTWNRAAAALEKADSVSRCSAQATSDAKVLWRTVKAQFHPGPETTPEQARLNVEQAIDDYLDTLTSLQKARASEDPAAVCAKVVKR